jgi:hypothetical protein
MNPHRIVAQGRDPLIFEASDAVAPIWLIAAIARARVIRKKMRRSDVGRVSN